MKNGQEQSRSLQNPQSHTPSPVSINNEQDTGRSLSTRLARLFSTSIQRHHNVDFTLDRTSYVILKVNNLLQGSTRRTQEA